MKRVDFFCVGCGKSGTTWLWSMLRQNPGVFLPSLKEMHYFNEQSFDNPQAKNPLRDKSINWYLNHYAEAGQRLTGDFTPCYIWDKSAAKNIFRHNPRAKIILIVRNPYERTWSQYQFAKNQGRIDDLPLSEAVEKYPFLLRESQCADDLAEYMELFEGRVLVLRFEEIKGNGFEVLRNVEAFLEIPNAVYRLGSQQKNAGGRPRMPKLVRMLTKTRIWLKENKMSSVYLFMRKYGGSRLAKIMRNSSGAVQVPYDPSVMDRPFIVETFNFEIKKLENLTGWDLGDWYMRKK